MHTHVVRTLRTSLLRLFRVCFTVTTTMEMLCALSCLTFKTMMLNFVVRKTTTMRRLVNSATADSIQSNSPTFVRAARCSHIKWDTSNTFFFFEIHVGKNCAKKRSLMATSRLLTHNFTCMVDNERVDNFKVHVQLQRPTLIPELSTQFRQLTSSTRCWQKTRATIKANHQCNDDGVRLFRKYSSTDTIPGLRWTLAEHFVDFFRTDSHELSRDKKSS